MKIHPDDILETVRHMDDHQRMALFKLFEDSYERYMMEQMQGDITYINEERKEKPNPDIVTPDLDKKCPNCSNPMIIAESYCPHYRCMFCGNVEA